MKFHFHLIACAASALLGTGIAHATDTNSPTPIAKQQASHPTGAAAAASYASREGQADEREQLAAHLRAASNRAELDRLLVSSGFRISAVNEDNRDELEYEVVRGQNSYEVQVAFANGSTARPTQIEVVSNLWQADTTERMLQDPSFRPPGAMAVDPQGRYSDRRYLKNWTDEKDRLEKALPANLKVREYRSKLEALGYQVTAVNDRELNHWEFEIVRGDNSYEVQIDVDPTSQMAREIDVTSNLWEVDATEAATDRAERIQRVR
jgi:hypothetical protein